jgi:hypothetical protein
MSTSPERPKSPRDHQLSVEIGNWFRASATGAGVIAIPVVVLFLLAVRIFLDHLG